MRETTNAISGGCVYLISQTHDCAQSLYGLDLDQPMRLFRLLKISWLIALFFQLLVVIVEIA